jgi:actin, other eukaryote
MSSVQKIDGNNQNLLLSNIVLSGGTTYIKGFTKTVERELLKKFEMVSILEPKERNCSSFVGGSILSSLSTFQGLWVSKEDYEENGPFEISKSFL